MKTGVIVLASSLTGFLLFAESAIGPCFLVDSPDRLSVENGIPGVDIKACGAGNFEVGFAGGLKGYPGVSVRPAEAFWDLSAFGHVECHVVNLGASAVNLHLRVDQYTDGKYVPNSWNTEQVWLKPGEARSVRVIFGYQYGQKSGYPLRPGRIGRILFFLASVPQGGARCRIEGLQAAGSAGEKPAHLVEPSRKPAGGVLFASVRTPEKGTIRPDRPWDLSGFWHLALMVRNSGARPVAARARLRSVGNGTTDFVEARLAPGEVRTLDLPFPSAVAWQGPVELGQEGTGGTAFDPRQVSSIELLGEGLQAIRAAGDSTPMPVPDWLGKRPPVLGDWQLTLDEPFATLDSRRWNVAAANYWDKRTHFSSNNLVVAGGRVALRYEKKFGCHNDNPADPFGSTPYACGFLSTYGKWTQRYGYFEARMKLPAAPGLWPAFWLMPDRGTAKDPTGKQFWLRTDTGKIGDDIVGGMEFDIMEHLTAWGPNRFNIAFHWDGYGKNHRSTGTDHALLGPDAGGFITVGLLWEPGHAAVYGNGRLMAEWRNPRVSDVPAYIMFDMVSGGWANNDLDDAALPADFTIDYVRVWQEKSGLGHAIRDGKSL